MSKTSVTKPQVVLREHQKWREIYQVGWISSLVFAMAMIAAVVAYFIWPYSPGVSSIEQIFRDLQSNRFGALVSMDFLMVLVMPIMVLPVLALFFALLEVNPSYAVIALVLGLMGNTIILAGRPVAEMSYLSDQYMAALDDLSRTQYLAAGEAIHTLFNGTAWMASLFLVGFSGLINSLLMFHSQYFSRPAGVIGLVVSIGGLGFLIPVIGPLLSLAFTIGGVAWYLIIARVFQKLGQN